MHRLLLTFQSHDKITSMCKKMKQLDDIIVAIATPIGEGGISVIRVSGKGAIELVDKGFRGKIRLQSAKSHTLHYGKYVDATGETMDEVVASVFRAPNSYTAEDVVELSCHGGVYVSRRILESVIANGARLAEPGEFTKRAFLNGRLDLSQAEAVADLIKARSERSRRSSLVQLEGSLSTEINQILSKLTHLCGLVELELDFVEEGITLKTNESIRSDIQSMIDRLVSLVSSFSYGRLLRDGVKVVLAGRPNVGKSSLLNALLDQNRAIVTEIPGTTRDVIEENLVLDGILFRLVDTAGIRSTLDPVEMLGVERSKEQIRQADICLYIVDISKDELDEEVEFLKEVSALRREDDHIKIIVANKSDISNHVLTTRFLEASLLSEAKKYLVSAKTREGIQDLAKGIVDECFYNGLGSSDESITVTNERHKNELESAIKSLKLALHSIEKGESGEVIALDLRGALNALGAIVGTVTTDDILNSIFSKFCIGK